MSRIGLQDVDLADCRFLYTLLEQRDPSVNISHKEMPSYEQHVAFIASHPYPFHKIIWFLGRRVGVIYVTSHDEVGIQIEETELHKGFGSQALRLIMEKYPGRRLLANINPKNEPSKKFFEGHGFTYIQNTYTNKV
jgi:RimJ/RimL family protein N-acetyltransferase